MRIVFLMVTAFLYQMLGAMSDQELLLQGKTYFFEGDFNKALLCYEQISQKNSIVWLNMGNCYFNEKNNIKALLCWKRAEKHATFSQLGKLFESENKVCELLNCHQDSFFIQLFHRITWGFSLIKMQIILLMLLILLVCLWYQSFVKKSSFLFISCKKKNILVLLFLICSMCVIIMLKVKHVSKKQAVIMQSKVAVHVGPETTFAQKILLSMGTVVEIVDEKNDMIKIIYPQGSGWILADRVEVV